VPDELPDKAIDTVPIVFERPVSIAGSPGTGAKD
jgi:hypothetical protein